VVAADELDEVARHRANDAPRAAGCPGAPADHDVTAACHANDVRQIVLAFAPPGVCAIEPAP
jgi:hypothetical protein